MAARIDQRFHEDPPWELVELAVKRERSGSGGVTLGDWAGLRRDGPTWALLIIQYMEHGFSVHGYAVGDRDYYMLYDPKGEQGEAVVEVWDGGNTSKVRRRGLVPEELALTAAKTFLETCERDASLEWDLMSNVVLLE